MSLGPMQVLVIGFDEPEFNGEILEELRRLREQDIVRLIDLVLVAKDAEGNLATYRAGDEPAAMGALAGALFDLGEPDGDGVDAAAADDVWYVADVIQPGSAAAVAVLEHRWAMPLRDAIERAGGSGLADEWLHPSDLVGLAGHLPVETAHAD